MTGSSKPLASLSSGLLARKGHAKPAMRPQGFLALKHGAQDDLGWNDMGDEATAPTPKPVVLRQREALHEQLTVPENGPQPDAAAAPEPAPASEPERVRTPVLRAATTKARIAFTLRLDAERHLRLRLASSVTHRSPQSLVTEALDRHLDSLTDVDALAHPLGAKDHG